MIRRTLVLLALVIAGMGGGTTATSPAAATVGHELIAADGIAPAAFVRSGGSALTPAWQDGSGPAPRPVSRRADASRPTADPAPGLDARAAACAAVSLAHRDFSTPLALRRAGLPSVRTTAPPSGLV